MAGNVATDIDRDGQSRDMGRGEFDGGAQRGCPSMFTYSAVTVPPKP